MADRAAPPRPGPGARLLAVVAGLVMLLALSAAPAAAHAAVGATTPAAGSTVDDVTAVTMAFAEPVGLLPDTLRILDTDGVAVGDVQLRLDDQVLTATLGTPLADGPHLVAWRVVASDGHPIEGAFTFVLGSGTALVAGTASSTSTSALLTGARGATTAGAVAGLLVLAGALLAARVVLESPSRRLRAERLAATAGRLALWSTVVAVPVQAALLVGGRPWTGVTPVGLTTLAGTSVGTSLALRLLALAASLWLLRRGRPALALAASGVALASLAISGHTRTTDLALLDTLSDVVHLAAAAAWLGGLVVLADVLRGRGRDRTADDGELAGIVGRFSGVATIALVSVGITGSLLAAHVVDASAPWMATDYGRALVAKVVLVAVLAGVGAWNRVALVDRLAGGARPTIAGGASDAVPAAWLARHTGMAAVAGAVPPRATLRRTVRAELGLFAAVVLATSALVDLSPPVPSTSTTLGAWVDVGGGISARVDAVVDRAGPEDLRVRLLGPLGQPVLPEDVRVVVSQPALAIGATSWTLTNTAPGVWVLADEVLALPGRWDVQLVVRTSRFEEQTSTILLDVPEPDAT